MTSSKWSKTTILVMIRVDDTRFIVMGVVSVVAVILASANI